MCISAFCQLYFRSDNNICRKWDFLGHLEMVINQKNCDSYIKLFMLYVRNICQPVNMLPTDQVFTEFYSQ